MKKEDTEMMLRIFETERAGYAYLYPSDGGERKEDYISTTAENIANYIGSHMFEAEKIVITDMCGRLILDTCDVCLSEWQGPKTVWTDCP